MYIARLRHGISVRRVFLCGPPQAGPVLGRALDALDESMSLAQQLIELERTVASAGLRRVAH